MTDSLTGGLRFGPQDRLKLQWEGGSWCARYVRYNEDCSVLLRYGWKQGLVGETAEEVARNAIQAAQLNEATR